jgi:hypothetical protein
VTAVDLPPELAPAQRARVEQFLSAVPMAAHPPARRGRNQRAACHVCHRKDGPMGGHHLVHGDDSTVVPVHRSCHRKLHPKTKENQMLSKDERRALVTGQQPDEEATQTKQATDQRGPRPVMGAYVNEAVAACHHDTSRWDKGLPPDRPTCRSRETVEASGYEAICLPPFGEQPGCENHHHVPGERRSDSKPRLVELPDIPLTRVRDAVRALLDHPLDDVVSVHIEIGAVTAVVCARDADGQKFIVGTGEERQVAMHELVRRVSRD